MLRGMQSTRRASVALSKSPLLGAQGSRSVTADVFQERRDTALLKELRSLPPPTLSSIREHKDAKVLDVTSFRNTAAYAFRVKRFVEQLLSRDPVESEAAIAIAFYQMYLLKINKASSQAVAWETALLSALKHACESPQAQESQRLMLETAQSGVWNMLVKRRSNYARSIVRDLMMQSSHGRLPMAVLSFLRLAMRTDTTIDPERYYLRNGPTHSKAMDKVNRATAIVKRRIHRRSQAKQRRPVAKQMSLRATPVPHKSKLEETLLQQPVKAEAQAAPQSTPQKQRPKTTLVSSNATVTEHVTKNGKLALHRPARLHVVEQEDARDKLYPKNRSPRSKFLRWLH
ncbi:MAG: hypothetical protein MHM6MM_005475 [Cercozoa sp. M6MM]